MLETFDFAEALGYLRDGKLLARSGWNDKGMFIYLVDSSTFSVNRAPLNHIFAEGTEITYQRHIDIKTADGSCVPWLASQSDLLGNDWEVVENNA